MDKRIVSVLILSLAIILAAFFIYSCGQQAQQATTPAPTGVISGKVLVPASAVSGLRALAGVKKQATGSDGVSDTPLAGASVMLCDPVMGTQVTDTPTATAAADGTFTFDVTGVNLPSGDLLFKAYKTSGSKTVIAQALYSSTENAEINAGTTLAVSKVKEELVKKCGDLLEKASSLPADKKAELKAMLETIFDQALSFIGTVSSDNIPTMAYDNTGKTLSKIERAQFETLTTNIEKEFAATTIPDTWNTNLSSFYGKAVNLAGGATYPSGLEIDATYKGFVLPTGMTLPSGAKFLGAPDAGASFLPSYYYDRMPSAAYFGSGFVIPSGGVVTLPSGARMGGGFNLPSGYETGLPSGVYFESGCDVPSGTVIPSGAFFQTGFQMWNDVSFGSNFVMPQTVELRSGFVVPSGMPFEPGVAVYSGVSFGGIVPSGAMMQSGFMLPSGMQFQPGATMGSGVQFGSGFVMPSGMQYGSGFVMLSGMQYGSGFVMPSGVQYGSGFVMPSGVDYASGFVMPTGVQYASGYVMPSGIDYASGYVMPSGILLESGYVMPSGMQFGSGFVMPSGMQFGSGFVPPSGLQYESGFQQPSGWVPPSGYVPPSGWISGQP